MFSRSCRSFFISFFFFNDTATTEIYTLSLHDALPISSIFSPVLADSSLTSSPTVRLSSFTNFCSSRTRSEEHTSELQSRLHLVCRLLLEKKKKKRTQRRQGRVIEGAAIPLDDRPPTVC